eukprot:gene8444-9933_t
MQCIAGIQCSSTQDKLYPLRSECVIELIEVFADFEIEHTQQHRKDRTCKFPLTMQITASINAKKEVLYIAGWSLQCTAGIQHFVAVNRKIMSLYDKTKTSHPQSACLMGSPCERGARAEAGGIVARLKLWRALVVFQPIASYAFSRLSTLPSLSDTSLYLAFVALPMSAQSNNNSNDQVVTGYSNDLIGFQEYNSNKKRQHQPQQSSHSHQHSHSCSSATATATKKPRTTSTKCEDVENSTEASKTCRPRKNQTICTVCEKPGDLLMCDGACLRSFHPDCIGSASLPTPGSRWECDDCLNQQNSCFACKKRGIVNMDLLKCKVHQCGKFYHYKCVSEFPLAKMVNTKSPRFNCPLHYCAQCGVSGDGKQSVHCFRCPTAFHVICMPCAPGVKNLTKSKVTRKTGLILCPKHHGDPLPSATVGQTSSSCSSSVTTSPCLGHKQQQQSKYEDYEEAMPQQVYYQQNTASTYLAPVSPISSPPYSPVESSRYSSDFTSSSPSSPVHSYYSGSEPSTPHHDPFYQSSRFNYSYHQQKLNLEKVKLDLIEQQQIQQQQQGYRRSSFGSSSSSTGGFKINNYGSNFVPSISTAPSPALSRSNSSEHLFEDLMASSLVNLKATTTTTTTTTTTAASSECSRGLVEKFHEFSRKKSGMPSNHHHLLNSSDSIPTVNSENDTPFQFKSSSTHHAFKDILHQVPSRNMPTF